MSYLKKDTVIASIKSRSLEHNNEKYIIFEAYLGTDPYSKKPVRMSARNVDKLRKKITEFFKRLSTGGDYAVLLDPYEAMDARKAIDLLKENKREISLVECVRRFLSDNADSFECTTTLLEAFSKYQKVQEGKSEGHQKAVNSRVGRWINIFGSDRLISEVTPKEVSKDLEERLLKTGKEETKTTYNNHLNYIKTFLEWCAAPEQSYITKNPLAAMKLKIKAWRDPEYLHYQDCEKLFRELEQNKNKAPADLADAILSFFCAMRQEEIQRVRLGNSAVVINLEECFIRVIKCKGALKGVHPRAFTIPKQALAWMRSFDFMKAITINNNNFRDHLKRIANSININLPKNVGRHTFCTMFDAAYHDQVALSAIAGNSEDIRSRHYNGVATEKEGREFFKILPSTNGFHE